MAKKNPAGTDPASDAAGDAAADQASQAETGTPVRVLCAGVIDGVQRQVNDIIRVANPAAYAGQVDADPAAVAYAESLRR